MANRLPLVLSNGQLENLQTGDILSTNITGSAASASSVPYSGITSFPTQGINSQTGTTYTFTAADGTYAGQIGNFVLLSNAATITATMSPNSSVAFPVGTTITLVQYGAGKVTITAGAGVAINSQGGFKSIGAQYVAVSLIQTATDTWLLLGSLIS